MNSTLDYITKNFKPVIGRHLPYEIFNVTREVMAKSLADMGFTLGAEIGVAQGDHAKVLCEANPKLKLFCIDIWDRYPGYNEFTDVITDYYNEAKEKLAPFKCELIKKMSMDAVNDFKDGSLDFVYIDGGHDFKNIAMDISEWSKKVRVGGIVMGHDYKRRRPEPGKEPFGVKDVVQAYCYNYAINPWFVLENNIKNGLFGRDNPAWMFVRQEGDLIG